MRNSQHILTWLVIGCLAWLAAGQSWAVESRPATRPALQGGTVAVVELHSAISDFSRDTFIRRMKQAQAAGASIVIINLDTYGGAVTSALEISHYIKSLDDIHVIAFVNSKAYSAGALIAAACDEIVMTPNAAIGDCAPIMTTPTGELVTLGEHERAKSESPVLADFENSARVNRYNPLVLRAMVKLEEVVHLVTNEAGEQRIVGAAEYADLTKQGWTPVEGVSNPVDSATTLLTVDAPTAIALGLATRTARSTGELIADRGLTVVGVFESGMGDRIVELLSNDFVRSLVMMIFFAAVYAAFKAPGTGFPEAIALIALGIILGVPMLTGFAQWWEVLAILVGLALLAVELFVLPGFGIAGISGLILIVGGLLLTFMAPEPGDTGPISLPTLQYTWDTLQRGLATLVLAGVAALFLALWLRRYLPSLPYFNRMVLTGAVGTDETAMAGSLTNIDPLEQGPAIGAHGKAITDLKPGGSAEFTDPAGGVHVVAVVSEGGFVPRGSELVVRERHGNRIVVRPDDAGQRDEKGMTMTFVEWAIFMAIVGVILLIAELLLPTGGVLGIAGGVAFAATIVFCFLINRWLGVGMLMAMLVATPFVMSLAMSLFPRTPAGKKMLLGPVEKNVPPLRVQIGQTGVTISELRPMGTCEFGDERVEAISEYGIIAAGTKVRIVNLNNRRPTVRAEA